MKRPRISWRTKILVVAAFIAVALVGFFVGNPAQRFKRAEEEACHNQCSNAHRSWRLVSKNPTGSLLRALISACVGFLLYAFLVGMLATIEVSKEGESASK